MLKATTKESKAIQRSNIALIAQYHFCEAKRVNECVQLFIVTRYNLRGKMTKRSVYRDLHTPAPQSKKGFFTTFIFNMNRGAQHL